jgi:uncharacterized membrane protein YeaQ/YmgE (transglycosylase-associated protein family)
MGILSWLVIGLIVGVLAKFIMPGRDPGGIIVTILLGIAGAFVGGYIGAHLADPQLQAYPIRRPREIAQRAQSVP